MAVAGFGATFSAFVLMLLATILLQFVPPEGAFAGAFRGIRAASAALILAAAFALGKHNIKGAFTIVVLLCAFALVLFADVSAPLVILAAGTAGCIYQWIKNAAGKARIMIIIECLRLLYTFFIIGIAGFGGGYAMMSMIITESAKFGITTAQMADLNALDMVVPGPIAINAATYVGYLHVGFWGSLAATIGVALPSIIIVVVVMRFIMRYRENRLVAGFLSGIKPAAAGLIAAAALTSAQACCCAPPTAATLLTDPLGALSLPLIGIFAAFVAVANIRFRVNLYCSPHWPGHRRAVFGVNNSYLF